MSITHPHAGFRPRADVAVPVRFVVGSARDTPLRVVFRPARPEDLADVHSISDPQAVEPSAAAPSAVGRIPVRRGPGDVADTAEFHVLTVDDVVVATVGLRPLTPEAAGAAGTAGTAELHDLWVARDWRRRGFGRLLLACALTRAAAAGFDQVVLLPRAAAGWFHRHGFTPVGLDALPADRRAFLGESHGPGLLGRGSEPGHPVDLLSRLSDLRVTFTRSGRELRWDPAEDTILLLADSAGVQLDSMCWSGVCGTCRSTLVSGTVHYLSDPTCDLAEGEILPCVTAPVTDVVLDA
ncbi:MULTISPECIES: GNAT family N-acetyltransferase [unclassified Parafrankia]|uniref:GNAT family N-acetyltransferase n=1 Tax=unclassified Parafrankia TaxID=2994368 RepID=UPI000DA579D9|nr:MULTISPECIES: GNAT family N-acetyltransferase [unclassified Parafrankia]TCJ37800.1 GNAT family N-acetyltransferase [Parafrankia sp. BMG5.11]SQD94379.1 GCN5-related N-acetyltransferase [Parafrankia sp. Ea1.12]